MGGNTCYHWAMEPNAQWIEKIGDEGTVCEPLPSLETLLDPPFVPHRWIRGGHLQSVMSLRSHLTRTLAPTLRWITLGDGDRLAMMDDLPDGWTPGDHTLVTLHGLCGSSDSAYMQRLASRFTALGVRVFRLNLRGCGAGLGHANQITHAGRSADVCAGLRAVAEITGNGPLSVVGVSLGGNQLLRALGMVDDPRSPEHFGCETWLPRIHRAAAVSPPIDLHRCSDNMSRARMAPYNRFFIRHLLSTVSEELRRHEVIQAAIANMPKNMRELDERVTAPLIGFRDASHYYQSTAACRVMSGIAVPTLILAANDDPIVPASCFGRLVRVNWPSCIQLVITRGGGHVGFIGEGKQRHWMDGLLERWFGYAKLA